MILHHIADGSCFFVVACAAFQTKVFCHRDLNAVDIAAVPDWFKDAVGQTKDQYILYSLFAEVMVDAIDLLFFKNLANQAV